MFEKLLALMPYNPSLIHQMGFYARRMREEAAIRKTGLIFLVLAFFIQFFAFISPPLSTSAASGPSNDLVNGGFSSVSQATSDCKNNVQDYKTILNNYGINCDEVASGVTINSFNPSGYNRDLYSMGRFPYNLAGEQTVYINSTPYYVRFFWAWGPNPYKALQVKAVDGTTYWLLYGCGNIVSVGVPKPYTPPPPPPSLKITKTTIDGYPEDNTDVSRTQQLGYKIYLDNTGGSAATSVDLKDNIPPDTTFVSQSLNTDASVHDYNSSTRTADWQWNSIAPEQGQVIATVVVKVDSDASNGEKLCNQATVSANGIDTITSDQVCHTVNVSTPPKPTPTPTPTATPTPTPSPAPTPTPTPTATPTPTPSPAPTCLYDTSILASSPDCKVCQQASTTTDILACVAVSKTAANQTENIADANNTTAKPGDIIVYTLNAKNYAKAAVTQYTFQDSIGDILVYADPVNLNGGTLDPATGIVSWGPVTIGVGDSNSVSFSVKVKNPIPATGVNAANPNEYDFTMTNIFGNTINIHVPQPTAQVIVTASTTLVNTGPGYGMAIAGFIVFIAAYFYARSRLLIKESTQAIKEVSLG